MDETCFGQRKYYVGHQVPHKWVFGGYKVENKVGFWVQVTDRSKLTLEALIQKYIHPNFLIV